MRIRKRSRSSLLPAPWRGTAVLVLTLAAAAPSVAEPPETAESAEASAATAVLVDLPMLVVTGSHRVHFDLAPPGDPPIPVVLDTGFNNAVAGTRGLEIFGGKRAPGDTEIYLRETVLGRPLTVGRTSSRDRAANEYPFIRFGGSFLRDFVLELDFVSRRVRFLDAEQALIPESVESPDEAVFDLAVFGSRPALNVSVNGHPTLVALDTSALVPVWLTPRNLTLAAISPKELPVLRRRGSGQSVLRVFETDTVQLGDTDIGVFPVIVSKDGHRDAFGSNGKVLGLDLLSQFDVRLDIRRSRLWLRRTGSTPTKFAGLPYNLTRTSGAYIAPFGQRFEVFGVLPGSPAESMGLLAGDRIDPEKVGVTTQRALLSLIRQQAPLLVSRPLDVPGQFEEVLLPEASPADP